MPPGSGKTWVGLMIAKYLKDKKIRKPIYICMNPVLKEQVKEKAKSVGLNKLEVALPSQINNFMCEDTSTDKYHYIVDEYYHMIR